MSNRHVNAVNRVNARHYFYSTSIKITEIISLPY